MKVVSIYQKDCQKIELEDNDSSKRETYVKKLSSLLSPGNNINILTTTSKSLILRPSKIISILVEEILPKEVDNPQEKTQEEKSDNSSEDIITDKQ